MVSARFLSRKSSGISPVLGICRAALANDASEQGADDLASSEAWEEAFVLGTTARRSIRRAALARDASEQGAEILALIGGEMLYKKRPRSGSKTLLLFKNLAPA